MVIMINDLEKQLINILRELRAVPFDEIYALLDPEPADEEKLRESLDNLEQNSMLKRFYSNKCGEIVVGTYKLWRRFYD